MKVQCKVKKILNTSVKWSDCDKGLLVEVVAVFEKFQ